ncbi:MAG: trigger factor [Candidatus Enteromonas sp.]
MKHTIKELGTCRVEITVDVDETIWADAQKKALDKALKNVSVKGFRKGHAPRALALAHVDQSKVINAAIDDVLTPVYADVLNEEKIQPFSRPSVNITKLTEKELTIVYTLTTMPKVTLGAYTGIEAKRDVVSVSEEEVAKAINDRLANAAELTVVEREAKVGDTVVLDFKGFVDGKAFEGGEADNYALELGSHAFVPGFEEALVGVKAGDNKSITITFPEQYVKELAGKEAVFECAIHEVKEKSVPAPTEETIADLGLKDVKTVEELKEFEKKNILERKTNAANSAYYNSIVEKVVANATVTYPDEIIENDVKAQEEQTKKQIEANGLTLQQYLEITGQTEEAMRENLRKGSEANLKTYLVLQTIAAAEHMIVDDAELDVEISHLAEQYKMKVEDVKKALGNNLASFRDNLQNRKIQEFLLANNGEASKAKKVEEEPKKED